MATRFYLPASGTAPITAVPDATWTVSTGFETLPTDTVKTDTALAAGTARTTTNTTTFHNRLDRVFVSTQQLAAQTIAVGTFSAVLSGVENTTSADWCLQVVVNVVSADGATIRGAIYAGSTFAAVSATTGADNQEWPVSTAATRIKNALATNAVTAQSGDRIQIEIGLRGHPTNTAYSTTITYGDPSATADFALTAGLTTALDPWVELSQTVTFGSAPATPRGLPGGWRNQAIARSSLW